MRKAEWKLCLKWPAHNNPSFNLSSLSTGPSRHFFPLRTYWHPRWAILVLQPAHIYLFFFFQDSFFLNTELLGRSCHFAKGSTFPVLIPYPFHLFSQVTGKGHVCAHMQQVCSNSVSPGGIGGTVSGCVGPAAHWGEAVPRPLLLLQDNSGLFWVETWKEVHKF